MFYLKPSNLAQSKYSDAIMFLKVTKNRESKCYVKINYYCKNLMSANNKELRYDLIRNIRLIEDRIRIKLILLEIEEKQEMSSLLRIKEPHTLIVPNFLVQGKLTKVKHTVIIAQDKLNEVNNEQSMMKKSNVSFMNR